MKSSARDRRGVSALSLSAGLLAIAAIGVLWLWPFSAPSSAVTAVGTASISLQPPSQTVDPGVTFDVQVRIDPQGQGIAAADVYIDFDPQYLSVVEIVDGTTLEIFAKPYSNAMGTIAIGAGTFGSPVTSAFTLVTLRMQGKVGTGSQPTEITFSFAPGRVTVVKDEFDQDQLATHTNGQVTITGATPQASSTPSPTATATQISGRPVRISISPPSQTVNPGVTFDVQVRIDPQGQGIAAADVYIDFDPRYLSVVEIVDGTTLEIFAKPYNNTTGTIAIGAGTFGSPVTSAFTLVTLRMQGKVGTGSQPTEITFSFAPGRVTVVKDEFDQDKLGGHTNGYVYVTGPTPTGPPPSPTRTRTPTYTATATGTTTPTQTRTPTITPTPEGTPSLLWFQDGREPNASYSGTEDTYLDNGDPAQAKGAQADMRLRHDGLKRPMVKFDLSQHIPVGSPVVEAKLYLWAAWASNDDYFVDADLYRVNRHWDEMTATWNQPWQAVGCDHIPGDREGAVADSARLRQIGQGVEVEWDITELVQQWVSNPAANEGVLVVGTGGIHREVMFRSSEFMDGTQRPKLKVRFHPLPPTRTPTRTATGTSTPTATPTRTMTAVPGGLDGLVWNDLNGNMIRDTGEPGLAGVVLRLYEPDHPAPEPPFRSAPPTGADGVFDFGQLPSGLYILVVDTPGSYVLSTMDTDTFTVVVSPGGTTPLRIGAWIPRPTATASPSPTRTIHQPLKFFLPIIIRKG